jgi:hypothetical protein
MDKVALAKVFLFIDDPYGDGIRLDHVRNPSAARLAALDLVRDGQESIGDVDLMLAEHGEEILYTLTSKLALSSLLRNTSLTDAEVKALKDAL